MSTLEQKIAATEAKLARLRTAARRLETGQKIVLGGMLLAAARSDPQIRSWLLAEAQKLTREADRHRIAPLLDELHKLKDKM